MFPFESDPWPREVSEKALRTLRGDGSSSGAARATVPISTSSDSEGIDALVLDETDLDPPRVLQSRSEEVHTLLVPVQETHVHFAEVVL